MVGVVFNPTEARDAVKEYDAQVIGAEYSEQPFGMAGAANIQRQGKVLCLKLKSSLYEKDQFEWFPPSAIKQTKWVELLNALAVTGALAQTQSSGANDDERITNFGKSLIGMKFHWEEKEFQSLVKEKGSTEGKKFTCLVPTKFYGKVAVEAQTVRSADLGAQIG